MMGENSENIQMLDKTTIDALPKVISDKYLYLLDVMSELGQNDDEVIVSSLIQTGTEVAKDILQITVRIPVLVFMAAIIKTIGEKHTFLMEGEFSDKKTIFLFNYILKTKFSDSSWEEMLSFFGQGSVKRGYIDVSEIPGYSNYKKEYIYIRQLCFTLKKFYYHFNIGKDVQYDLFSEWRNNCFGHTAFNCRNTDKEYLEKLLKRVNDILCSIDFKKFNVIITRDFLDEINYGLFFYGNFVFDSFDEIKNCVYVQNFENGKKEKDEILTPCFVELKKYFDNDKEWDNISLSFSNKKRINKDSKLLIRKNESISYNRKSADILIEDQLKGFPNILIEKYNYLTKAVDILSHEHKKTVEPSLIQSGKEVAKDILQIAIRIPVTTFIAAIIKSINDNYCENNLKKAIKDKEQSDKKTVLLLDKLINKVLSDGIWEELLSDLGCKTKNKGYASVEEIPGYTYYKTEYEYLRVLCGRLKERYYKFNIRGKRQFSQWRNEALGHSSFNIHEDDIALLDDLLTFINSVLKVINFSEYSNIIKDDFLYDIEYNLYVNNAMIYDSYVNKKGMAYLLDYETGNKFADIRLSSVFNNLTKKYNGNIKPISENISYDDNGIATDETFYYDIPVICEYLYGDIFKDIWDSKNFSNFVLLIGESGIGKTRMSDFLDNSLRMLERFPVQEECVFCITKGMCQRDLPIHVWTYHINSYNTHSITGELGLLEFLYNHVPFPKVELKKNELLQIFNDSNNYITHSDIVSKNFGEYISVIIEHLKLGNGKLVIILDGIDKIRTLHNKEGNLSIMFKENQLPKNVTFIFTTNNQKRIDDTLIKSLTFVYEKSKKGYISFLNKYIDINMPWKGMDKNALCLMSNNSIRQLSAICNVAKYRPDIFDREFYGNNNFSLLKYLKALKEIEGAGYCNNVIRILCTLTLLEEPLSMQDIAIACDYIDENIEPLPVLYKYINDIRAFLTITMNSSRGDLYSLEEPKWIDELGASIKKVNGEQTTFLKDVTEFNKNIWNSRLEAREIFDITSMFYSNSDTSVLFLLIVKFCNEKNITKLDENSLIYMVSQLMINNPKLYEVERCLKLINRKLSTCCTTVLNLTDEHKVILLLKSILLYKLGLDVEAKEITVKLWDFFQGTPDSQYMFCIYNIFFMNSAKLFKSIGYKYNNQRYKKQYQECYLKLKKLYLMPYADLLSENEKLDCDVDMLQFLLDERKYTEFNQLIECINKDSYNYAIGIKLIEAKLKKHIICNNFDPMEIEKIIVEAESYYKENDCERIIKLLDIYETVIVIFVRFFSTELAEKYIEKAKPLRRILREKALDGVIPIQLIEFDYFGVLEYWNLAIKKGSYEAFKEAKCHCETVINNMPEECIKLHFDRFQYLLELELSESEFYKFVKEIRNNNNNNLIRLVSYLDAEEVEAKHRNSKDYWARMYTFAIPKIEQTINFSFAEQDNCSKYIDMQFNGLFSNIVTDDALWDNANFALMNEIVQFLIRYSGFQTDENNIIADEIKNVLRFCYTWIKKCQSKFVDPNYNYEDYNYNFAYCCILLAKQYEKKDIESSLRYYDEALDILSGLNINIPQKYLDECDRKIKLYENRNIKGKISFDFQYTVSHYMGRSYLAKAELYMSTKNRKRDVVFSAEQAIKMYSKDLEFYRRFEQDGLKFECLASKVGLTMSSICKSAIAKAYVLKGLSLYILGDYRECVDPFERGLNYGNYDSNSVFNIKTCMLKSLVITHDYDKSKILLDELYKLCVRIHEKDINADFYRTLYLIQSELGKVLVPEQKVSSDFKVLFCKRNFDEIEVLKEKIKSRKQSLSKISSDISKLKNCSWWNLINPIRIILLKNNIKHLHKEISELNKECELQYAIVNSIIITREYKDAYNKYKTKIDSDQAKPILLIEKIKNLLITFEPLCNREQILEVLKDRMV